MQTLFSCLVCFQYSSITIYPDHYLFQPLVTPPTVLLSAVVGLSSVMRKMFTSLVLCCSSVALLEGSANPQLTETKPQRALVIASEYSQANYGWVTYCYLLTACIPPFLLRSCGECSLSSIMLRLTLCKGIRSPEQQHAWREKNGFNPLDRPSDSRGRTRVRWLP